MRRTLGFLAVALLGASMGAAGEVRVDGRAFVVPDGFTVEKVAAAPGVDRPIVASFDELGRLYVADSSGSNEKVQEQLLKKPHRIVRLEDPDGDGRLDRSTVFADRMMFPEGAMWREGSLYVAAPPSIWKLTDLDGDGRADLREEWFRGKTLTGCANDLHGPYPGPDGRIYWCKGAFAPQTYERPGKPPLVTRAAHIFRARPDGSEIEPVMTGGMDNPVDVVFTPGGEPIFTTTFLQHPGGGRRDGLIHAIHGGVYGKIHDVIDGHPRTGPDVMPVMTHLGPAAPSGLVRLDSDALGFRNQLLACQFNLRKVSRHVLIPDGATFRTEDSDFLASDDTDFHPTDVIEDADGSVLVIDTGGWYKLCCPTSQIVKPDVLGGIYRVRRTGMPRVEDPRGLAIDWAKATSSTLANLLADPRPAVRDRAVSALGRSGAAAVPALLRLFSFSKSGESRRLAIWAACRIDAPEARALARLGLQDDDETVRLASAHSVSLWRDASAEEPLGALLRSRWTPPLVRRAAAEALGRIGRSSSILTLLDAPIEPNDRILRHAVTFALIEINDPNETVRMLAVRPKADPLVAMFALEGMGRPMPAPAVVRHLGATDRGLREGAAWLIERHPEYGDALAGTFREWLGAGPFAVPAPDDLESLLARFSRSEAIRSVMADVLKDAATPRDSRLLVLRSLAGSAMKDVPAPLAEGVASAITSGDADLVRQGAATARALASSGKVSPSLIAPLKRLGDDPGAPAEVRLDALAAGPIDALSPETFAFLIARIEPTNAVAARSRAVEVLTNASLDRGQLEALARAIRGVGPVELPRLLPAFAKTTDAEVGRALVASLSASGSAPALRLDTIRPILAKFGPEVENAAGPLYAAIDSEAIGRAARLDDLVARLKGGDVRRGQAIFNSPKAACTACHAIGYVGGTVGPDLTNIGKARTERDLLESILYPSASFVRSYEPVVVATTDGRLVSGTIRKDSAEEVVLATGPNQEVRIPRAEIDAMKPGTVSVMPAGLDRQFTEKELADLLAFLKM